MADRPRAIVSLVVRAGLAAAVAALASADPAVAAESPQQTAVVTPSAASRQVEITADRIEHFQLTDVYEANGSVVIVQGALRLTADHATLFSLSGTLVAEGHVHLKDRVSEVDGERLELNVNTEAGVITRGQLYINRTNSLFTGRLMQRFSEDHYRAKEGAFTNCDARQGETPAWRFTFKDADLISGDQIYLRDAWLCVNDIPIVPIPDFSYPVATARKSGLLVPTPGYDNRFGWTYRQSLFWAFSPSQDLTVSPQYWSDLGYGADFEYRYVLDRKSKGQWLVSLLQQQSLPKVEGVDPNSSDAKRTRALISGMHNQQVNPDLRIAASALLASDPEYLSQLSNSGAQRAMPGGDSSLLINQRLANGNAYLLGQYIQPFNAGGTETFQRLPEAGLGFADYAPFGGPVLLGLDSRAAHFYREQGFQNSRVDLLPSLSTRQLEIGHVIGFTPQIKFRETYYTHSVATSKSTHRETFWAGLEAASSLARRFDQDGGGSLLHTIEPKVVYEYVPPTDQSKIVQIDDVDNLQKKNLVTYSLQSRLLRQNERGATKSWLDLTVAQSYRPGSVQTEARQFAFPGSAQFGTNTQQAQPATAAVAGKKFSDVWMRAVIGDPALPPVVPPGQQQQMRTLLPVINNTLTMDAFFDPYKGGLSQWNTDLRFQQENNWYVEIGQRFTRSGNRVRRGDIWNPISFNEVFEPTPELNFTTFTAATRLPLGWTVGAKAYYDFKNGQSPELDVVALYQNQCKCWSAGFYFLQFPDRQQYNFMISLTGIGWTENFGTAVLKSILSPLLVGERGLPWAAPGGPYGRLPPPASTTGGPPRP
jgi:LPS-assembly protein